MIGIPGDVVLNDDSDKMTIALVVTLSVIERFKNMSNNLRIYKYSSPEGILQVDLPVPYSTLTLLEDKIRESLGKWFLISRNGYVLTLERKCNG